MLKGWVKTKKEIECGDVVMMKSDVIPMTVNRIIGINQVECIWFDENQGYHSGNFFTCALDNLTCETKLEKKWLKGDIVDIRNDKPKTISKIINKNEVECVWFDGNVLNKEIYDISKLIAYKGDLNMVEVEKINKELE